MIAPDPGKFRLEGGEQVIEGPANDHIVVEGNIEGTQYGTIPYTLKEGTDPPHTDRPLSAVLPQHQLHIEQRHRSKH